MSKIINVRLDNKPIFNISVTEKSTVKNIKNTLKQYFAQNNLNPENYNVRLFLNATTETPVFTTRQYDI